MQSIKIENALGKDYVFIDVRTPKEFEEDTIPGAINIPLFSNEERAIVGRIYIQESKEKALNKGLNFVSQKLPSLMEKISQYKKRKIIIFCWRGGMRSGSLTGLLKGLNYNVFQLEGGYKAYRNYILKRFEDYKIKPKLIVLNGLTGVGKTEILQHFHNSLDLENLAQHRSSILGGVGLKPRSQKMFDSLLFKRLEELKNERFILIEGESRKIGKVQMPQFLFKSLKEGIQIKIEANISDRIQRLIKEYAHYKKELKEKIFLMKKAVGNEKKIKEWIRLLEENKFEELTTQILKEYYDPLYKYTVENIKYDYIIDSDYIQRLKKIIGN